MTQDGIIMQAPDDDAPEPGPVSLAGSSVIDGRVGGVLIVGNWKLVVPRGAYNGVGTITVSIPDVTVDQCDLSISPASLNHFENPVDLRFRCATLTEAERRDMRWWNPASHAWVVLKSWPLKDDITRCSQLMHFSKYASGKAGW